MMLAVNTNAGGGGSHLLRHLSTEVIWKPEQLSRQPRVEAEEQELRGDPRQEAGHGHKVVRKDLVGGAVHLQKERLHPEVYGEHAEPEDERAVQHGGDALC